MSPLFTRIVSSLLPHFDISLAFVDAETALELNKRLRGKTYVPNVLSYVVGEKSGEIIICKSVAKKEAPDFGLSYPDFLTLLFIHALLHLKGGRHGSTMEKREWALLKKFGSALSRAPSRERAPINVTKDRNRNRRRNLPS